MNDGPTRDPHERTAAAPAGAPTWLGPIRQTAFVVDDVETTARSFTVVHGIGPWFLFDVDLAESDHRGSIVPFRASMGLAQSGGQQIELIDPDAGIPSIYNDFIDAGGTGVHHVCYWSDLDRARRHFESAGAHHVQSGTTGNGNGFLYMSGSAGVPYVEIVDPVGQMETFFDHIASSAIDWDGTDPVRRM